MNTWILKLTQDEQCSKFEIAKIKNKLEEKREVFRMNLEDEIIITEGKIIISGDEIIIREEENTINRTYPIEISTLYELDIIKKELGLKFHVIYNIALKAFVRNYKKAKQ